MARGKKNNRFNNKKKNKGSKQQRATPRVGVASAGAGPVAGAGPGAGASSGVAGSNRHHYRNDDPSLRFDGIADLKSFRNKKSSSQGGEDNGVAGGYYEVYKEATTKFWLWMKRKLPNSKMVHVNDLQKGVHEILEKKIETPKHIIDTLSTSVKYRRLFTATRYGDSGGDEGHKYMTDTLSYCRRVLRRGRQIAPAVTNETSGNDTESGDKKENDGIGGRFESLLLNDEESDSDEDLDDVEDDQNPMSIEAPKAPEKSEYHIVEDLINGDNRFQAIALLHTMEELMRAVDGHYGLLRDSMGGHKEVHDTDSTLQLLMECTVVTNMATESIQVAENALMANHPHIKSFYHVLALIFLPSYISRVENLINRDVMLKHPHIALDFAAEVVESTFHNRGHERLDGIASRFTKKSGVGLAALKMEAKIIHAITFAENHLALEAQLPQAQQLTGAAGLSPHSWFSNNYFIGGDRCILNTQKIVQLLMDTMQNKKKLAAAIPNFWGTMFDERVNPATCIRGDLDEMFGGAIMPELMAICAIAPFRALPDRAPLLTVLDLLQEHVNGDRTRPAPISLTFGLHAILTSIITLQGDGRLARLASISEQSYNKLFEQLDGISDFSKPPQNAPVFYANVCMFKNLAKFAKPASANYPTRPAIDPALSERVAFWNPVIGGEFMLYGTYICSIGLGSACVDSVGQLRFTLHLYNALKQANPALDIPFLQALDTTFKNTKAVWVGGRPNKGSYEKSFWMAWGVDAAEASRMSSENKRQHGRSNDISLKQINTPKKTIRDLDEILPEEYSASYRRLVVRDFVDHEGVAEYTAGEQTQEATAEYESLLDLLTRANMTRDGMDDDEEILPTNFPVLGVILLEFANALEKKMGWDKIINRILEEHPENIRAGKTMGGRQIRPGGFLASDFNYIRQGMAHMWAMQLSQLDAGGSIGSSHTVREIGNFMAEFFQAIPKERYCFFVETEKEEDIQKKKNPLLGSYAYGRTGRTPSDPLRGFFHLKYSKSGTPTARLIKPGKYTPFDYEDGEVANPYTEPGFRLRRQPRSGKYRHIASYTIDELISIGWDGAKYVSTKSRNAAAGQYVPFIPGYDSDSCDEYEEIDFGAGKRAGTIGLPSEDVGLYMTIPTSMMGGDGGMDDWQLVQLQNGIGY